MAESHKTLQQSILALAITALAACGGSSEAAEGGESASAGTSGSETTTASTATSNDAPTSTEGTTTGTSNGDTACGHGACN